MSDPNGQASAPEDIDSLAAFLVDNPDSDEQEPLEEELPQNSDESKEDNSDEKPEDDPADEGDKPESDKPEVQTGLKFKVPVKGEDGADSIIEVDEKELISGYQRHADYTRKTMELATQEREVTQLVAKKLEEGQGYYMQQAQMAHAAVRQLAGLKSPEEMAQLAQSDPASWVQEQQRERAISGVLSQLEQGMQRESAQAAQQQNQHKAERYQKAWVELSKDGIDKPALSKIFSTMKDKYAVPDFRLELVDDPILVRIMRDAAAYQDLKDKKATVTKKALDAPKLPPQRQSVPKNEQANRKLSARFDGGKAKLRDLAAYLNANDL